ncbi:hypothetical protein CMK11_13930 [Candidatus Poribacteria bacterium]|nr:hypothetical protein [Candidatus Poribacteria bacterium]
MSTIRDIKRTRAFLQGIYGIGPEKAKTVSYALGPNAMERLIGSPMTLAQALGYSKTSYKGLPDSVRRSVECVDLWADLVAEIIRPVRIAEVPRLTGCHAGDAVMFRQMDCLIGLGKRLRHSLIPDEESFGPVHRQGASRYQFVYRGPTMAHAVKGAFGRGKLWIVQEPAMAEWPWPVYSRLTTWAKG